MKGMKKLLAVACAVALSIPTVAIAADMPMINQGVAATEAIEAPVQTVTVDAVKSGKKISVAGAKVTAKSVVYNGGKQEVKPTVKVAGKTLKKGTDYVINGNFRQNAGTYTMSIYGIGKYTGKVTKSFTVKKAEQKIKANPPKVSAKDVKKASKKYTLKVTGIKANAKVSYSSNSKKITVSKTGKITVKKGTKKGTTAKITIKVASTKNYKSASKTVTIKVAK